MENQQNIHPVAQQLSSWLGEAITLEEVKARVGIAQGAIDGFVEQINKQLEAQQAQATTESGEKVEVEEVTE